MDKHSSHVTSVRRDFLKTSALAAAAAGLGSLPQVHAAGGDTIRVGLIGCGGRGTGAAGQALNADANVKLVAMADMFADRVHDSLATLRKDEAIAGKVDVKPECCFTGFDAYKQVLACPVDVVLLASPPHFRPAHIKAAVEAGKHIFAEKPIAVDAPGVRSVLASCAEAKRKNLSVVSGLCYRYEHAKRETMKRIHDGQIGDVVALHTNYLVGGLWMKPRQSDWTDMEWQLRNWLYFTWLSGDHIVEQHIHSLDKMAWVMKDQYPARAVGLGGRQARVQPEYGHIFDHHAVTFEYPNGTKIFSFTRQQNGCANDVNDYVMGTKGSADIQHHAITGSKRWRHRTPDGFADNMYQNEHNELFASIRSGNPINNADFMCKSTLMSIMGRMATYSGQVVTWEQAMNSREDLTPARYVFDSLPVPPVAVPGQNRVV